MPTKPGLMREIKYAGLEEKVIEWLFKEKLSYKVICEKLSDEYDISLTEASIGNFKKYVLETVPEFLAEDKEYRERLAKKFLDTTETLIYAISEIKTKIEEFNKDPDMWRQHSTYLMLLLNEANLLLKRAGEIKPTQYIKEQNIANIQINQLVQGELIKTIESFMDEEGNINTERIREFYRKIKQSA